MFFYLRNVWFQALRYTAYPLEMVAPIIRRLVEVGFIVLFWLAVARSSNGSINPRQMTSYVLIATSVAALCNTNTLWFGGLIGKQVKMGEINSLLIRPINLIPYLYSTFLGQEVVMVAMSILTLFIGIALNPVSLTFVNVMTFIVMLIIAIGIAISFNVLIGITAFYITEATSVRHVMGHIIRTFSGAMIPISFFHGVWQKVLLYSPFPVTIYGPASILTPSFATISNIQLLLIGAFWLIALWAFSLWMWKKALTNYDAIGL